MKKLIGYQKGINLGGWLSQGVYTDKHLENFITEKDIETIASWGADHVRLPIDFEVVENDNGTVNEKGYKYIDNCIEWCRKNKLNMVLDVHKTYGYIFDDPRYSADFFHSDELQNRFISLWSKLAERYSKDSDILMFEMLNEITGRDIIEKWNEIAENCVKTIRKYAPDVKILYGGTDNNAVTAIKSLSAPFDKNIVYNFHCYEPLIFTHQNAYWVEGMPDNFHIGYPCSLNEYLEKSKDIPDAMKGVFSNENTDLSLTGSDFFEAIFKEAIEIAEKYDVSLYCGEYGVINQAYGDDMVKWLIDINKAFDKFGIGRALWTYKQKDFGISDEERSSHLDKILNSIF